MTACSIPQNCEDSLTAGKAGGGWMNPCSHPESPAAEPTIRDCIVKAANLNTLIKTYGAFSTSRSLPYEAAAERMSDATDVWIRRALAMEPNTLEEAKDLLACFAWWFNGNGDVFKRWYPGRRFEAVLKREDKR